VNDGPVNDFVHTALEQGALPSLTSVAADLRFVKDRGSLLGGLLSGTRELCLKVKCYHALEPQLEALGLVRQLPALATLALDVFRAEHDEPVQWPPFIPLSLKALRIVCEGGGPSGQSLLRALPGMLGASGARLERLEITIPDGFEDLGDGLVHLAQALRCCSPTIRVFRLVTDDNFINVNSESGDHEEQEERLRVQWADLLAGVSTCRELEVLVLLEVPTLFPPGTAFPRLTHLEVSDDSPGLQSDPGTMGLWELMASGGLPALAKLKVWLGCVGEGDTRVAPALEAVAGTLTELFLTTPDDGCWVERGYELGVAVGKLRWLKDLALDLSKDGQAYHAVAQGVAISGWGGAPSPPAVAGEGGLRCPR
jgi:hypothetical protein